MDGERAGVDITDRVDEAHHPAGAAHVQPGQGTGSTEAGQVEERVAGQYAITLGHEPVVQLNLLVSGRVQLIPDVGTSARWTQPSDTQRRAVPIGESLEVVELADVVAGDHH